MRVPSFRKYSDFTKDSQNNHTYLLQWQVVSGFALKIVGQIIEEVFLEVLKECNLQYNLVFGASVILKQTPPPPHFPTYNISSTSHAHTFWRKWDKAITDLLI